MPKIVAIDKIVKNIKLFLIYIKFLIIILSILIDD
jgi:hypothetical protein